MVARRTGIAEALVGAILLGGITSLPELATTSTAALAGDAPLAVSNIVGGVSLQLTLLAGADAMIGDRGLSTLGGTQSLVIQGNGLMMGLTLVAMGIVGGAVPIFGVDLWTVGLAVLVVGALAASKGYEERPTWRPVSADDDVSEAGDEAGPGVGDDVGKRQLITRLLLTSFVVIAGGYLVTIAADALADQTGLGSNVMGTVFLAAATSMPEVSTTIEAVRLGRHRLAFSNIFGTNLFDVGLIFVADVLYRQGSVLDGAGESAVVAAGLGVLLTGIYIAGIVRRRRRVVLRMGLDSLLVLVVYGVGLVAIFGMK